MPTRSKSTTRDVSDLLLELGTLGRSHFVQVALDLDLTPPQVGLLMSLDDPMPMGQCAAMHGCDPSNITWLTDRLEERGLIARVAHPKDRRVKQLVLTDTGHRMRRQVERRIRTGVPGLDRLTATERATLARLLERMLGG